MANKVIIKGKIGNAITSVADDHIVAVANDIYDETHQMYQSDINTIALSGGGGEGGGSVWSGE